MTLMITDRRKVVQETATEDLLEQQAQRYSASKKGDPNDNRALFRRKVESVRRSMETKENLEATCLRLQSLLKASPDTSIQVQGPISPSSLLDLM